MQIISTWLYVSPCCPSSYMCRGVTTISNEGYVHIQMTVSGWVCQYYTMGLLFLAFDWNHLCTYLIYQGCHESKVMFTTNTLGAQHKDVSNRWAHSIHCMQHVISCVNWCSNVFTLTNLTFCDEFLGRRHVVAPFQFQSRCCFAPHALLKSFWCDNRLSIYLHNNIQKFNRFLLEIFERWTLDLYSCDQKLQEEKKPTHPLSNRR